MQTNPTLIGFVFITVTCAFFLCVQVVPETSAIDGTANLTLLDCKEIITKMTRYMYKQFSICAKDIRTNSTKDEYGKKLSCIIKCLLDRVGLLNEEGKVTKETTQRFLDEHIPKAGHEFTQWLGEHCVEAFGSKLDPTQQYCESYGEFTKCVQGLVSDMSHYMEGTDCKLKI